ncbi:sensor histidine kinase [Paractinoplanes atraurantiacus]|uniref:histidine kinase n=1 Tax=Paractinoplanes atraurantiacus TaxID=1036182 RepID=A0A285JRP2_9ACTN|nr:HAMP domain-containing sensor histidine kinase [Actinoplanes atraurantiacus]SNY62990.1 two-component system, OmpR family, sensor histidine kinase BaeS [Actinoplanes atraurantiacus]
MLRTFAGRAVLVTAATAVISVIITALVALPIAVRSANNAARADLAEKAALAVELLASERAAARTRIVNRLRDDGIAVYLIRRGAADRPGLPARVVQRIAAGEDVDTSGIVGDQAVLISGRPLTGNDAGVVLTRKAGSGTAARVLGGVWIALLAGLAGGVVAGALLAHFIARPLRQAALAAKQLSAGDRSVRLPVRPPAEAAELATALNQLGAALQRSEGREREFLLSVSHELRTPLATIRGYAEALADGVITGQNVAPSSSNHGATTGEHGATTGEHGATAGEHGAPGGAGMVTEQGAGPASSGEPGGGGVVTGESAGRIMLAEADRLERLISDLLVLSRLEAADLPVRMVAVDLADLVGSAAEAWAPRCAVDGPRLRAEIPERPVMVTTDPGRLRQVIDGLGENALRVLPPGAPLILAVRAAEHGGVVEVRDGGPGFTDDDLSVAFQRGALQQRYKHERKTGSGLGLALAARLVERLGGTIEAAHAPEGGAMFRITLPRAG